jgi:hypothetical protein
MTASREAADLIQVQNNNGKVWTFIRLADGTLQQYMPGPTFTADGNLSGEEVSLGLGDINLLEMAARTALRSG